MRDALIQPSADEIKNGWTAETLTAYLQERDQANKNVIEFQPGTRELRRPRQQNSRYRVTRWRG